MPGPAIHSLVPMPDGLIATLFRDGRIAVPGAPQTPVAAVGYKAPPPGPRLLDALAALLAAEGE